MDSISIVIPVFNAGNNLKKLYDQLIPALEMLTDQFEVIMVEDCGQDDSWSIIQELAKQDKRIHGIKLSRNYGQHNAILCGIRAVQNDIIITMDDDLQNPVSEIPILLNKLSEGYDVVYGTPAEEQHGILRDLASRVTKLVLQSGMGVETARNVSAFRAFRTPLREAFADYRSPTVSIDVLLTWATSNFSAVKVLHSPRMIGESNYSIYKLINHAFNLLTGFSTVPLQMASLVGFIFTLFGFAMLAWVLGRYLFIGSSVPGFPFLASMIAIFSGAQLFALGIFGEYLARIHFRTMNRPPYMVREECNTDREKLIVHESTTKLSAGVGMEQDV